MEGECTLDLKLGWLFRRILLALRDCGGGGIEQGDSDSSVSLFGAMHK